MFPKKTLGALYTYKVGFSLKLKWPKALSKFSLKYVLIVWSNGKKLELKFTPIEKSSG